jgi:murein DD-endopeptidase MepM/ murein hydrolase activator NlpD
VVLSIVLASAVAPPGATASTHQELARARQRLDAVVARIRSQRAQLERLRDPAGAVARQLSIEQGELDRIREDLSRTRRELDAARRRYEDLRARLDTRIRQVFIQGPGGSLEVLLSATSLSDLTDRIGFVSSAVQADADLANEVHDLAEEPERKELDLRALEARRSAEVAAVRARQAALNEQLAQQLEVYRELSTSRDELEDLVAELGERLEASQRTAVEQALGSGGGSGTVEIGGGGPFAACPVAGPRAYGDDLGAPRPGGRTHQGNDIFAPYGTPIVAPFPGRAVDASNAIGGYAVIVYGARGFVYNAHMSRIGKLGNVDTGDVIGYVGDPGNARGTSPHDHFEWHPGNGPAVNPYPYLNEVC